MTILSCDERKLRSIWIRVFIIRSVICGAIFHCALFRKELFKIENILSAPNGFALQCDLKFEWGYDWSKKLLQTISDLQVMNLLENTHLCVNHTILWTRNKHETLDFREISQFRWVEFSH
jgi:hypothetical protein